jgi:hypothetical protein
MFDKSRNKLVKKRAMLGSSREVLFMVDRKFGTRFFPQAPGLILQPIPRQHKFSALIKVSPKDRLCFNAIKKACFFAFLRRYVFHPIAIFIAILTL